MTHIFFLDTVCNRLLEDQVVAHTWRMVATGSVAVENLVAKGSLEEVIHEMNDNTKNMVRSNESNDPNNKEEKLAQLHALLKSTS